VIPTVFIVAVALGFVFGITHNKVVLGTGSAVTVVGWLVLVSVLGDIAPDAALIIGSTLVALANLVVGILVGWGLGLLLRNLFGMTAE